MWNRERLLSRAYTNFIIMVGTTRETLMADVSETQDHPQLTWKKVWAWVGIIYVASFFGFLIRVSAQIGGLFKNIYVLPVVILLPAIHMFWFAVIIAVYLATKKFDVSRAQKFMKTMAWLYVIYVAFRLISVRPI